MRIENKFFTGRIQTKTFSLMELIGNQFKVESFFFDAASSHFGLSVVRVEMSIASQSEKFSLNRFRQTQ